MQAMMYYRFEIGSVIRQHPFLFFPLIKVNNWVRGWDPTYITPNTEVVIEGYFRTGNTFAERAFTVSQPERTVVAYHTHAIATLLVAAKRNLPTLVLLRQPTDTVISAVLKIPGTTLAQHLEWYIRYYECVDRLRTHFYLVRFGELTTDFGQVILNLNRRFGTDFAPFDHTPESVQKVFDWIEKMDRRVTSGNALQYSIPQSQKRDVKAIMTKQLQQEECKRLLERANHLYESLCTKRTDSNW